MTGNWKIVDERQKKTRYMSVCSGIEAATVAWQPLGWSAVAFAEIEKFPSAVLQHHYPETPNHGDINDFKRWPDADIDVLVGGTPCQSFSVAGPGKGLADPRGNLALVYLAITARYRPKRLVWENVPGVFSSNEGRDFGGFIGAMVELGYSCAWRVLDAQYFGVPQRRRRVFVVGSLRGWRDSAAILLEPESMRRNPAPSRETRQDATSSTAKSIRGNSGGIDREDMHTLITPPITSTPYGDHDSRHEHLIPDVANPLTARMHKGINTTADEGQTPIVTHGQDVADPISANEQRTYTHEGSGNFRARNILCFDRSQITHPENRSNPTDQSPTLAPTAGVPVMAFKPMPGSNAGGLGESETTSPTLHSQDNPCIAHGIPGNWIGREPDNGGNATEFPRERSPSLTSTDRHGVVQNMAVRRLTPLECERLQGFPDGYTDIPGASDSARYKALGNSMAVPVMRWIGERIQGVDDQ